VRVAAGSTSVVLNGCSTSTHINICGRRSMPSVRGRGPRVRDWTPIPGCRDTDYNDDVARVTMPSALVTRERVVSLNPGRQVQCH
jgi:hypothetical protein